MSTIFDEVSALGFCIYPTEIMHDVEAEAHTLMALHVLAESGLLATAGEFVVQRAAAGVLAPSRRYSPGSREDKAEALAASHYRQANAAMVRLAQINQAEAFRMAETVAGRCQTLIIQREMAIAKYETKH